MAVALHLTVIFFPSGRIHERSHHACASSRGQAFRVTGEHGGLTDVVQTEVQHGDSLQSCEEQTTVRTTIHHLIDILFI